MGYFSHAASRYLKFLAFLILVAAASAPAVSAQSDIVLYAAEASSRAGNWLVESDGTAAGGRRIRYPDAGLPKLTTPLASPTAYFELTFNAEKGIPYRLWMRGNASANSTNNDSAYVQFSGSVDAFGNPVNRISTTSAFLYNLEECTGCGLNEWGWNDNLFGGLGPLVYFATTGPQTIRIQLREDGLMVDQVVLSPATYLAISPGWTKGDSTILLKNSGTVSSSNVVLWAGDATVRGSWMRVADNSAAGQIALQYPDFGGPRLTTALASPTHYFDMSFSAQAGVPYRLWMRGKAIGNSTNNDSVWVQFSNSLNQGGGADYRIGTSSAIMYNMEECTGCGLSNWGWNDTGMNGMGPLVFFAASGTQTIRVQLREDGINLDQIVLSPQTYLGSAPGAFKNDSVILPREGGSGTSPSATPNPTPVPNQPPTVSISATPTSGFAPLAVAFNSTANDPDGSIVSRHWTFGDGTGGQAISPDHVYSAGTYTARVTVTDNAGATASAAITITATNPPVSSARFKVMHWNVAYGRGTDNIIDLNRQATWMANMQPDLISLNEVPPENIQRYIDLLRQKTGATWYSYWVAITPGNNVGQQILSRYPLQSTNLRYLSFGRSVAQVTVSIGGRTVNFFSTHLSYESASWRQTQLSEMHSWLSGFSEQRIVAGDYNLFPHWAEYGTMTAPYYDSWAQAKNAGTAIAYPDNPDGLTRKGRVDFINYSKSASGLRLVEVRMPDQRDLNNRNVVVFVGTSNDWGVRPSDHNFLVTTFEIR